MRPATRASQARSEVPDLLRPDGKPSLVRLLLVMSTETAPTIYSCRPGRHHCEDPSRVSIGCRVDSCEMPPSAQISPFRKALHSRLLRTTTTTAGLISSQLAVRGVAICSAIGATG